MHNFNYRKKTSKIDCRNVARKTKNAETNANEDEEFVCYTRLCRIDLNKCEAPIGY